MKIAVDLDQVLGNFLPALIKFHNTTYKTKLKPKDFTTYHLWEVWGGTKEQAIQKIYDFNETSYFRNIKPVKGAKQAMKVLKKDNELFLITSRSDDFKKRTEEWVERNFPNTFQGIYFTNSYSQSGTERTKAGVCDNLNVDVLVDDNPTFAEQCVKSGRKIFLFDFIWNKNTKPRKGVERVYSWKEILGEIQKLKK